MTLGMVRSARSAPVPGAAPGEPAVTNGVPAYVHEAQRVFAGQIAVGEIPTIRRIRSEIGVERRPRLTGKVADKHDSAIWVDATCYAESEGEDH
jgi:hypothetical protein